MKYRFFLCVMALFVSVAFGVTVPAQKSQKGKSPATAAKSAEPTFAVSPAANVERHKFTVGEKLTYNVKASISAFGMENANVAKFSTEIVEHGELYGRDGYRLLVKAETTGFIRATMFDLNDRFTTFFDAKTRLPYRAEYDIKQGPEERTSLVTFDQPKRQAVYGENKTAALKGDTYDAAGMLWATRNLDFEGEKIVKLTAFDDRNGRLVTVEVERLGVEKITVAGREVEAVQFALRIADSAGKINDDKKIRLWFTNDAKRYAVLITASPGFGDVRAELTRFPAE